MPRQPAPWRRGGASWYAQIDRRTTWLAPKDATFREAQDALYRILADRKTERKARADPTVRDVFNLHLSHCRGELDRGERGKDGVENKEWFLTSAGEAFGRVRAAQVGAHHVLAWLDANPTWKQSSRALATRHVKSAFAWAKSVGHIADNPLAGLKTGRTLVRETIPSEEQAASVLAAVNGPYRDFVLALIESGCRPGELRTLTADRVDLGQGVWAVLNKTRGKTGVTFRTIYLTDTLVELSRRLVAKWPAGEIFRNRDGRAWSKANLGKRMIRLRATMGWGKEITLYGMRHRFATTALVNSVPIATVAALLGHTTTNMVMRCYSKLNKESDHLRDAAKRARGAGPPEPPASGQ